MVPEGDGEEPGLIALDGVATARPLAAAVRSMTPWLGGLHADPEARHAGGVRARRALDEARDAIAALVRAPRTRVVFTSGATESSNLAIRGAATIASRAGRSAAAVPCHERPAVLHTVRGLENRGLRVLRLPVGRDGVVDPESLPREGLGVVAFSLAHAELGAVQDASRIVARARAAGALTVVDATLALGRVDFGWTTLGDPDILVLSFHRMGGPPGTGAMVARDGLEIPPLFSGGTAEGGVRPGFPDLAAAVGAGVACRLAADDISRRERRLRELGALLGRRLGRIPGFRRTGPPDDRRLPGHVSGILDGIEGEALVLRLDGRGVRATTGSPCSDSAGIASASLLAAGFRRSDARGALVASLPSVGWPGERSLRRAATVIAEEAAALRELAGDLP